MEAIDGVMIQPSRLCFCFFFLGGGGEHAVMEKDGWVTPI